MPELPDVTVYVEHLRKLLVDSVLNRIRIANPFLLRSVEPPLSEIEGRTIQGIRRIGKRIIFEYQDEFFLILHLMIAGRLHWKPVAAKIPARIGAAALDFPDGTLVLTEAGSKKRASLHVVKGEEPLREFDRGGLEVETASLADFQTALTRERHTLKRALTDPRLLSGIGNAYSDEILHRARLSPLQRSDRLTSEQFHQLYDATRATLEEWTERIRKQAGEKFPEGVTAFREEMAVHGRYKKPCPDCGSSVQRIRYADNETNYCAKCQTGGKLLADRSLSRLLKKDWPRSIEELEERGRR